MGQSLFGVQQQKGGLYAWTISGRSPWSQLLWAGSSLSFTVLIFPPHQSKQGMAINGKSERLEKGAWGVGWGPARGGHMGVGGASEDFLTLINVTEYFLDDSKLYVHVT